MPDFKVNFMILGAMRSGTTTLAKILENHPEVGFSNPKEPQFFSKDQKWKKNIGEYHKHFNFQKGKIFGEGSVNYTQYPLFNLEIWNDIYEYNPDMKFIYIVRNPVDRAISHSMYRYLKHITDRPIEKEISNISVIYAGLYFTQIKPFIDKFGKDKIFIIDFDDFLDNRTKLLLDLSIFLNIDFNKFSNFEETNLNKSIGTKKKTLREDKAIRILRHYGLLSFLEIIPPKLRNLIRKAFINNKERTFTKKPELDEKHKNIIINLCRLDIIALEKLIGKDLSKWK